MYSLDNPLEFGKYQGKTIREVAKTDPKYLLWCEKIIHGFTLSPLASFKLRHELTKIKLRTQKEDEWWK